MLRDAAVVVVVVVVRTRPRAIPLAMITIRKILHGFPFLSHDDYGAPLGGPSGHRSSAINYLVSVEGAFEIYGKAWSRVEWTLQIHPLQIHSMFYKSSPVNSTPLHVLQYASV